jgi:hypothetical protein
MIPNTDAARARVERVFRGSPAARGGLRGGDGGASVQSVPLDGVDVETCRYGGEPPHCNYAPPMLGAGEVQCPPTDSFCGSGGGDPTASDGWSWGSSGGDGSDPPPPDDGTNRPPCTRDTSGWCQTEAVDSHELQQVIDRINAMQDSLPECAEAKTYAQELVQQGSDRFRVWNGYDVYPDPESVTGFTQRYGYNDSDVKGRILVFDSYWLFRDRTLVAHEALHNYLHRINSPLVGDANEAWVKEWAGRCA